MLELLQEKNEHNYYMDAFIDELKNVVSPEKMHELDVLESNCDYYGDYEPYIAALDNYIFRIEVPYLVPKPVSYREEYEESCRLFKEIKTLREKIISDITEHIRKMIN